jgi:hypothetical protein
VTWWNERKPVARSNPRAPISPQRFTWVYTPVFFFTFGSGSPGPRCSSIVTYQPILPAKLLYILPLGESLRLHGRHGKETAARR